MPNNELASSIKPDLFTLPAQARAQRLNFAVDRRVKTTAGRLGLVKGSNRRIARYDPPALTTRHASHTRRVRIALRWARRFALFHL